MPCYVNIGAYIDEGTMMDTFSKSWKLLSNWKKLSYICWYQVVGGVLEPAQALPTIIEDNVFVRSNVRSCRGRYSRRRLVF